MSTFMSGINIPLPPPPPPPPAPKVEQCVPCKWVMISASRMARCDGASPCQNCTSRMAKSGKTWRCSYDSNFRRPRGGPLPDIYRVKPVSTKKSVVNTPNSGYDEAMKAAVGGLGEAKRGKSNRQEFPNENYDPESSKLKRKAPFISQPGLLNTTVDRESTTNTVTHKSIPHEYISVHALGNAMAREVDRWDEMLSVRGVSQKFRNLLHRNKSVMVENLYGGKFAKYVIRERIILSKRFERRTEEELVRANLEGCWSEGDWMGNGVV